MADPHHIPEMDGLDIWSVRLYRTGLTVIALGLAAAAWHAATSVHVVPAFGWLVVAAGASLATANLHLYAKTFRWVFHMATGLAMPTLLAAMMLSPAHREWVFALGLALLFVAISGFALKEQFCFQLPGMRLLPVLLIAMLVPWPAGVSWIPAVALMTATLLYGYLALAKWRMPLHFDVGDKSKYES